MNLQESKPSSPSGNGSLELDSDKHPLDEVERFDKSLRELKELGSQLYYAADYCETSFKKTQEKRIVMENTKEYICKAIVTVVDHLGSVSANLNRRISESSEDLGNDYLRMHCLKQRLLTCTHYSQNLTLSDTRWSSNSPRYYPRYIAPNTAKLEESKPIVRYSDIEDSEPFKTRPKYKLGFESFDKEMPVTLYKNPEKLSYAATWDNNFKKLGMGLSKILPARETSPKSPANQNPYFQFQTTKDIDKKQEWKPEHNRRRSFQLTRRSLQLAGRKTKETMGPL
ncbi:hypothetical protein C5167_029744 [Papaver somniferum]|uniref:probable protein ABIL5 n=1 Tax=Papaver somniferum TaxID=3469 RepID=UPI000E6F7EA9|nr:probable protein ABIL5 [Papaver somniferum]RZC90611.1 hypothetical protein C5167_029744 [Papaver somniferum]